MSDTWTIRELAERAADALRAHAQPLNGRVRDVPGERLIRWYTTIGLVDPPLTRRGRIAQYGRRHLLQLVAIKRLQAAGRSIAEIQIALTGATDTTLEQTARPGRSPWDEDAAALRTVAGEAATEATAPQSAGFPDEAGLPNGETPKATTPHDDSAAGSGSPRGRFWAERPADGTGPALPHPRPTGGPLPADGPLPTDGPMPAGAPQPVNAPPPVDTPLPPGTPLPANGPLPAGTPQPADALPPSSAALPSGAAMPADVLPPLSAAPPPGAATPGASTPGASTPGGALRPASPPPPGDTGRPARVARPRGALVCGVRLADGVMLVLDGAGRAPAEDDIQAVLAAAAPLLALLEERKLI
ncbi:helix-turn-helix domain-containing protein [Nonomuraea sp. NEAU-A123]|uniref:helix-turn-helix domain-containing protein n=1 Tax=Nonomuraea sp. NEAU-A123 TaxID=2839649 RepID=UPI001BE40A3A|nr:helix-turn-helix domain-containing protein [Nonomuraea sp. NEAU-A123]MBT2228891.1 MerR family transcriptional regulator [Nonomuraea sp. NEAU-A123]